MASTANMEESLARLRQDWQEGDRVGRLGNYNSLATTEVLDLETRKIEFAGELATPRRFFHIVKIVEAGLDRYLAMGGYDGSSYLDSVEEFDADTLTWKQSSNLMETRAYYGAVALDRSILC